MSRMPLPPLATTPLPAWDLVVRLSHWSIAVVVIANGLITEGGSVLHVTLGWGGGAILLVRWVWGVIGRTEARFTAFPPAPLKALAHIGALLRGTPREHASHNPAGALMIYALWLSLAVVIGTGLLMTRAAPPWDISARQAIVDGGDWSQLEPMEEGEEEDGALQEVHEIFANLMLILAVLHVAGVGIESRLLRRNLVKPMITGKP